MKLTYRLQGARQCIRSGGKPNRAFSPLDERIKFSVAHSRPSELDCVDYRLARSSCSARNQSCSGDPFAYPRAAQYENASFAISSCDGEISVDRAAISALRSAGVNTPTESITGASTLGELSTTVSGDVAFRCFAGRRSLVSFFSVEDLDVRGFEVPSAAVLTSGTGALFSSAIFAFFGALLDCMELIKPHRNKVVSICSNIRRQFLQRFGKALTCP